MDRNHMVQSQLLKNANRSSSQMFENQSGTFSVDPLVNSLRNHKQSSSKVESARKINQS